MLKDEEAQLKCSPEYAEGATINLTLVQVAEKHEEKARRGLVSLQGKSIVDLAADSTAWRTQNASRLDEFDACLMNEKAISDKTTTEKAESENVVAESVSTQQVSTEKVVVEKAAEERVAIAKSSVANVAVEEVAAKTKRIQTRRRCSRMYQGTLDRQRLEEERKHAGFLGWRQLASGLQMRRKTQVFRLLRTRSFSASHLRSNLSAMKARS